MLRPSAFNSGKSPRLISFVQSECGDRAPMVTLMARTSSSVMLSGGDPPAITYGSDDCGPRGLGFSVKNLTAPRLSRRRGGAGLPDLRLAEPSLCNASRQR